MKNRILSLLLVLCMVLPLIPLWMLPTMATTVVDGSHYDSVFARDVVFGQVPTTSWYTGQSGDLYDKNFNSKLFHVDTDYETFLKAFDALVDYDNSMAELIVDAGTVVSNGFDAEGWYDDIPVSVKNAMNTETDGGYVSRQVIGKAHKWLADSYNWVDDTKTEYGTDLATRAAQYLYAYTFDPTQEAGYKGPANIPKIIIATGNQSYEKGAMYGTYYLVNDILNNWESNPVLDYLRHNVKLVIVPCLSPGGTNQSSYWNANLVNINRNFNVDGYDFPAQLVGGYDFVAEAGGGWEKDATLNRYNWVGEGNGTHKQVMTPGAGWNKDGTRGGDDRYQNAGYNAFDQSESCALRDLMKDNQDAFLYVDFHTNTGDSLKADMWDEVTLVLLGEYDDDYAEMMIPAGKWYVDRFSAEAYDDYGLSAFGIARGQKIGQTTFGPEATVTTSKCYGKDQLAILSTTLEGISGWPGDVLKGADGEGRYSPMTQKADSEILGNYLIACLGQYAYNGKYPTATYTTSFTPFGENYPTIGNLPLGESGYDLSGLPTADWQYRLDNTEYPLTYNGNWQLGYKGLNADGSIADATAFTPYSGMTVTVNSSGIPNGLSFSGDVSMWGTSGCIGASKDMMMITSTTRSGDTMAWVNAATIRYTAEYDGVVVIDLKDIRFHTNVCQLLVLLDGEEKGRLKPADGAPTNIVDTNGNWTTGNQGYHAMTLTFEVKKGQHIDFVSYNNTDDPDTYQLTAQNYADNGNYEKFRRGVRNFNADIAYYQDVNATLTSKYSGKVSTEAEPNGLTWTYPTVAQLETFLTWYNNNGTPENYEDDTVVAANGTLTEGTSYAKINEDLINAGWIAEDATWDQAIDGFFDYLRSQTKLVSPSGWLPGVYETTGNPTTTGGKNDVFAYIAYANVFNIRFNLFSVDTGDKYVPRYVAIGSAVSGNYLNMQFDLLRNASNLLDPSQMAGTASTIEIAYDPNFAAVLPTTEGYRVGPSTYGKAESGHYTPEAMIDFSSNAGDYKGSMLRMQDNGSIGVMAYVVPAGVSGLATLRFDEIYRATSKNNYNFSLYVIKADGTAKELIAPETYTADGELAALNAKLKEVDGFSVDAGDRIELRFARTSAGASYIAPAISLTIENGDKWTGDYGATSLTSYETLFKWYDGESGAEIANDGALTEDDYAIINPYFTGANAPAEYKITANMSYKEAVQQFKKYLKATLAVNLKHNNWQPGVLEGADPTKSGYTNLSPVMFADVLEFRNVFGLRVTDSKPCTYHGTYRSTLAGGDVWISENFFDLQLQLMCAEIHYTASNTFEEVTDFVIPWDTLIGSFDEKSDTNKWTYSVLSAYKTGNKNDEIPYAWNANGGNWISASCVFSYSESDTGHSIFNGMTMRPWENKGATAIYYTVPAGTQGTATLTLDRLYFGNEGAQNGHFQWTVMVDGVAQLGWIDSNQSATASTFEYAGESDRVDAINTELAKLSLRVEAGQKIAFCVRRTGSAAVYVNPGLTITVDPDAKPVRRVQLSSGGAVLSDDLAAVGENLSAIIAAYRATDADFAANGCYINGVWYEASAELPAVGIEDVVIDDLKIEPSASIAIGATYSINVYLPAQSGVTAAGVKVNGVNIPATLTNGQWKVTVATVYAKDLLNTTVSYAPYYVVNGKESVSAKTFTVEAKELLDAYMAGGYTAEAKALAQAALDYATVAKAYFAGDTVDTETLTRLAAYDAGITGATANKLNKTGDEYTFALASLEIGDTINFIFAIAKKDGSDLTALDGALSIDGKAFTSEFLETSIGGQKMLIAVIKGVPEKEFALSQRVLLKDADGNELAGVTYSVKDYCIRTLATAEEPEANMIRAVYALGLAAEAYTA